LVLHLLERFILIASLRRRRVSLYVSLFTITISVIYTREFRENFEATTYIKAVVSSTLYFANEIEKNSQEGVNRHWTVERKILRRPHEPVQQNAQWIIRCDNEIYVLCKDRGMATHILLRRLELTGWMDLEHQGKT